VHCGIRRSTCVHNVRRGGIGSAGRTSQTSWPNSLLEGRTGWSSTPSICYYLNGFDLRGARQIQRKTALENLLEGIEAPIVYSEHLVGDGQEMFEHAAKLNWEGIISKNANAPYRSDRNEAWLKIKTVQQGKFPVIGFVKDPTGVAALYLGKREGNDLVYMGKVGTGWSRTMSSQIRKQLDTVVSPKSKLTKPIRKPKATWVEPSFMAEVEFRDITSDGLLRQSSFKGLSKGTRRT
jgi:bifunctional non-homologous end joining protein LigD